MEGSGYTNEKMQKGKMGVMWGSRDPILEFLDPPYILGTVEAKNVKFFMEIIQQVDRYSDTEVWWDL